MECLHAMRTLAMVLAEEPGVSSQRLEQLLSFSQPGLRALRVPRAVFF